MFGNETLVLTNLLSLGGILTANVALCQNSFAIFWNALLGGRPPSDPDNPPAERQPATIVPLKRHGTGRAWTTERPARLAA